MPKCKSKIPKIGLKIPELVTLSRSFILKVLVLVDKRWWHPTESVQQLVRPFKSKIDNSLGLVPAVKEWEFVWKNKTYFVLSYKLAASWTTQHIKIWLKIS